MIKLMMTMRLAGHIAHMGTTYFFVRRKGKRPFERLRRKWRIILKWTLRKEDGRM
jgi:hypothetical protein